VVGPGHVTRGKEGKFVVPGFSCPWIVIQRPGAAIAAARHVDADNEMPGRIDQFSITHQARPPFEGIAVARQRMEDPYHIVFRLPQLSRSGVGQPEAGDLSPRLQVEWPAMLECLHLHIPVRFKKYRSAQDLLEGLFEIGTDIVDMFDAHAHTDLVG